MKDGPVKEGPVKEGPVLYALYRCLADSGLWKPGAVLLAAVSGGCDSMALLGGLSRLRAEAGFTLHALHVQHGLRGADSLADEQLVRDFCAQHAIPLTVHQADLGGDLHLPGLETRARDCRLAFFAAEMQRLHGDALLLAHHQDDQTETVLMHLLRGAGSNGLAGMRTAGPFAGGLMLRPFLELPKEELRKALREWDVPFREDASNQEAVTLRNALRLQVLPLLEELSPGCGERIARTARLLRRDEETLSGLAIRQIRDHLLLMDGLHAIELEPLRRMDGAVALRALRLWVREGLMRCGSEPEERWLSAQDSEQLLHFVCTEEGSDRLNLPRGLQAFRGSRWLHLIRQSGDPLAEAPQQEPLPLLSLLYRGQNRTEHPQTASDIADTRIRWQGVLLMPLALLPDGLHLLSASLGVHTPAKPPESARTAFVPPDVAERCVFRHPLPGDTIHPLGAPGGKPLRRYLTDRQIDPPFRERLPVLAMGSEILWIPGLCTSQMLAHRPGQRAICISASEMSPYLPKSLCKGD